MLRWNRPRHGLTRSNALGPMLVRASSTAMRFLSLVCMADCSAYEHLFQMHLLRSCVSPMGTNPVQS